MLVGQQLGPFVVDKELGHGAMGAVYRARNTTTGQHVAIKIMAPGTGGPSALARFEREGAILKQLRHPNIVHLIATGKFHNQPFYAMEYIEGESLDRVMARRGRITWEEVVTIGKQLCAALQHAHDKGIVHRDLKPSNLMVLRNGTVKLTDFGIAKDLDVTALTSANCTVGTAAYMSPEQCRGERNLTSKSDLYSMGVMLYELVTGKKPFEAETPMDMFLKHVHGTFERPSRLVLDIPVWFDTLICQLLEKKPEQRPRDAEMVAEALGQVEEKVATLKSAGVDAAQMRTMDRRREGPKHDETDRQAARTLLTGLNKMKVRRQKKPASLPERKWLQAIGILLALALIGGFAYWMMRPASPDKLYAHAKKLMESNDPEQMAKARTGPIDEYLQKYGTRDDAETKQVWAWADQEDVRQREKQFLNRIDHPNLEVEEPERYARRAYEQEQAGNLDEARLNWQEAQKAKQASTRDMRVWGMLADRRLGELNHVEKTLRQLDDVVDIARREGKEPIADHDPNQTALHLIHLEKFGDVGSALTGWKELRDKYRKEPDQRTWFLLAAGQARSLETKNKDELKLPRTEVIASKLKEADAAPTLKKQMIYHDIVNLYSDDPTLQDLVKQAHMKLQEP